MWYRKRQTKSTIVLLKAYKDYLDGMDWIHRDGFEDETYKDVVIWVSLFNIGKHLIKRGITLKI